ncbi:MAG: hypothetical protein DRG11_02565 [Epsilonproteobacteria bacterium]|nr:MAG: hypothetical protein DRG11_02565 [Campylobacterota bacterium]
MKKNLVFLAILFATNSFGSAEINLNSNTLGALLDWQVHKKGYTNYYLGARYVNNGKATRDKRTYDDKFGDGTLASVNFKMMNQYRYKQSGIQGFGVGMGVSTEYVDFDEGSEDLIAVPLRLYANMQFNYRLSLDFDLAYAPKILTFQDGINYKEFKAKFNIRVIDNGYLFAGFRYVKAGYDYEDDEGTDQEYDVKLDDDIFGGFKIIF